MELQLWRYLRLQTCTTIVRLIAFLQPILGNLVDCGLPRIDDILGSTWRLVIFSGSLANGE